MIEKELRFTDAMLPIAMRICAYIYTTPVYPPNSVLSP